MLGALSPNKVWEVIHGAFLSEKNKGAVSRRKHGVAVPLHHVWKTVIFKMMPHEHDLRD